MRKSRIIPALLAAAISMSTLVGPVNAMSDETVGAKPWMNTQLSAKERTEMLLDAMTLDQKVEQIAVRRFNENDTGKTYVVDTS